MMDCNSTDYYCPYHPIVVVGTTCSEPEDIEPAPKPSKMNFISKREFILMQNGEIEKIRLQIQKVKTPFWHLGNKKFFGESLWLMMENN